ncbi:hypothetical protein GE21DRAFT_610 [Neurospora crassa]|uniref:Uncharacterized protein n=1 Tax=Neurospora crassa (strain ATCC 24698 / 74-OR23-1A / CBS 708.71 / DSM 1257 / FGSC 987) TaxID=367110 RepID=Q7SD20_NEUCR|nr:hypothetical protein NCU01848 [Neurospora crassa OR74A]EAA34646.1 hypothetical protein NCU01848 [Neurospora crassa OR74A]KHE81474.1 hypothetical protein GE21DRAFT_610 [Neurospora crassa]|eukprot:XP_963882.1 hypothetical protein NCU01848 [Neurospora crassa OR74A]
MTRTLFVLVVPLTSFFSGPIQRPDNYFEFPPPGRADEKQLGSFTDRAGFRTTLDATSSRWPHGTTKGPCTIMASDDTYHGGRFDEATTNSAIVDLQRRSGRTTTVWPTLSLSLAVALSVSIEPAYIISRV